VLALGGAVVDNEVQVLGAVVGQKDVHEDGQAVRGGQLPIDAPAAGLCVRVFTFSKGGTRFSVQACSSVEHVY